MLDRLWEVSPRSRWLTLQNSTFFTDNQSWVAYQRAHVLGSPEHFNSSQPKQHELLRCVHSDEHITWKWNMGLLEEPFPLQTRVVFRVPCDVFRGTSGPFTTVGEHPVQAAHHRHAKVLAPGSQGFQPQCRAPNGSPSLTRRMGLPGRTAEKRPTGCLGWSMGRQSVLAVPDGSCLGLFGRVKGPCSPRSEEV